MSTTRDRLLSEALKVFAQKGYDAATIGEISRQAGFAEGTIYRHFESKKELFIACLEPAVQRAAEAIGQSLAKAKSPPEVARAIVTTRIHLIEQDRDTFNILFSGTMHHPELFELLVNRILLKAWQLSQPRIDAMLAAGKLKRRPNFFIVSVGMTAAIWAMVNVRNHLAELDGRTELPNWTETLVDDLTQFVLYGIAGQPAGGDEA